MTTPALPPNMEALIDRDAETGCWLFLGPRHPAGYGRLSQKGKQVQAHRAYYEAIKGAIPDGMHLDHLCRNRACVNPDHLDPVTPRENVRRGLKVALKTHCMYGHELSGSNLHVGPRGYRVCIACRREAKRKFRAARAKPSKRLHAIRTPLGDFPSASSAARAHGLQVSTVSYRARNRIQGYEYV